MPIIQELSRKQLDASLAEAVRRRVPVAVTCRVRDNWRNLRSRILRAGADRLWLAYPARDGETPVAMDGGFRLGVAFKIKHHKHIFNAVVVSAGEFRPPSGPAVAGVCVGRPRQMQRVQRRAYYRVEVPRSRSILATFWLGSGQAGPTWEGWISDLSAGGFQVRVTSHGAADLEVGDVVGVRIDLGQEYEPVVADAQFRHQTTDDRGVVRVGFQFVGLNESAHGRRMLHRIGTVVCQFQRRGRRRPGSAA